MHYQILILLQEIIIILIFQEIGLTFGADTQQLVSDNANNFNITAGNIDFKLSVLNNINIETDIGLTFGTDSQKIEVNNTNEMTIISEQDINLVPGANKDINIPVDINLTFGADTQNINSGTNNNLNINVESNINIEAGSGYNINIPVNTGLMFGSDTRKINNDLSGDLNIKGDGLLNISDETITILNNDTQSTIGGDGSMKVYGGAYIQEDCSVKQDLIIVE